MAFTSEFSFAGSIATLMQAVQKDHDERPTELITELVVGGRVGSTDKE
jgi:hypothetical protein